MRWRRTPKQTAFPERKRLENEVRGLQKAPRERQETAPEALRQRPRCAPGPPQEASRAPRDGPRRGQERSKRALGGPSRGLIWTVKERLEALRDPLGPRGPPGAPRDTQTHENRVKTCKTL